MRPLWRSRWGIFGKWKGCEMSRKGWWALGIVGWEVLLTMAICLLSGVVFGEVLSLVLRLWLDNR